MADGGVPTIGALEDEAADPPPSAPSLPAGQFDAPTHDEIAALAYSYWETRGGQGGSACEDWLRAEQELLARRVR